MDTNEPIVNTFFISEKISKIRWATDRQDDNEKFLTGCWGMQKNFVRIWRLQKTECFGNVNEYQPKCHDKYAMNGDVTGMEMLTQDIAVVSCSDGKLTLLKIQHGADEDSIEEKVISAQLHKIDANGDPSPCTSISVYSNEVATVGEDGRLNIIDVHADLALRHTIEADSCSLLAVAYVNPQEVLTANRMGVIRMFDVRSKVEPTAAFMTSSEDDKYSNFVSCLTSYPTQPHIVLAGSEEGSITVWDLRQPGYPASYLSAHNSPITEIGFHHSDPLKLYSAAENGELWLWAQNSNTHLTTDGLDNQNTNINPWLNGERAKNRISVTSIISDIRKAINSFDTKYSKVICGSDSEAVYMIENLL